MTFVDTIPRHADDGWRDALAAIRAGRPGTLPRWNEIFAPLAASQVDELIVIGQIGQSLDGRAATATGHSHYINGSDGLDHLHRLRALVDAVVVGVGTALADDPQLTVRRIAGRIRRASSSIRAADCLRPPAPSATTVRAASSSPRRRTWTTASSTPAPLPLVARVGGGGREIWHFVAAPPDPPPRPSPTRGEEGRSSPAGIERIYWRPIAAILDPRRSSPALLSAGSSAS